MDTLTLDGKNYLSSKRAAEITGYAKDYVGQLCREGRVEARLVGRNWYILESSLHTHRFGAAMADIQSHSEEIKLEEAHPVIGEKIEEAVLVKSEGPLLDEELKPAAEEIEIPDAKIDRALETESVEKETAENTRDIENIQEAWKAWFSERATDRKDIPETQTTVSETVSEEPENNEKFEVEKESDPSVVRVKRISMPMNFSNPFKRAERRIETSKQRIHAPTQGSDMLVVKSVAIALAGLSISVAIIGAGALDDFKVKNSFQAAILGAVAGIHLINR